MAIKMSELKEIRRDPVVVEFSDKAIEEYNELVRRDKVASGIPTDDKYLNRCPNCGREFSNGYYFCSLCGQRLRFVESDTVPL